MSIQTIRKSSDHESVLKRIEAIRSTIRCPRGTTLFLLFTSTVALFLNACAGPEIVDVRNTAEIEALQDFEYIYVLGPFDIPDGQDRDGLQDRPRIRLWDRDGKVVLKGIALHLYREAQMEVIAMLGDAYKTVDGDSWHHNYHHVNDIQQGGIALADGSIVGWNYRLGGLGYLDFDYDPVVEKVAWFTPKLKTEAPISSIGRVYRARHQTDD